MRKFPLWYALSAGMLMPALTSTAFAQGVSGRTEGREQHEAPYGIGRPPLEFELDESRPRPRFEGGPSTPIQNPMPPGAKVGGEPAVACPMPVAPTPRDSSRMPVMRGDSLSGEEPMPKVPVNCVNDWSSIGP